MESLPTSSTTNLALLAAYAIGSGGEAMATAMTSMSFFFYNEILGLSGQLTSTAVFVSLLFDAFSDPVIGSCSDRSSSPWRRHGFMLAAPLPLALSMIGLYSAPSDSDKLLFAWYAVMLILVRTFTSVFHVPYLALGAALSDDYHERSRVMGAAALVGSLTAAAFHFSSWMFIFPRYDGGQSNRKAYLPLTFLSSIAQCACMLLSAWLTVERRHDEVVATVGSNKTKLPQAACDDHQARSVYEGLADVLEDLQGVLFNGRLCIQLGVVCAGFAIGQRDALHLYRVTFLYKFAPAQMACLVFAPGVLLGHPVPS